MQTLIVLAEAMLTPSDFTQSLILIIVFIFMIVLVRFQVFQHMRYKKEYQKIDINVYEQSPFNYISVVTYQNKVIFTSQPWETKIHAEGEAELEADFFIKKLIKKQ